MTPATRNHFLDEHLQDWIGLPYLDRVLDDSALSVMLGRPVRTHRLRVKPGLSLVVGWEDPNGHGIGRYGWTAVLADPDKAAGARRRATRAGAGLVMDENGPQGTVPPVALLSGGVDSDPGLARELAHARRSLPTTAGLELLAYNPGRRAVLAVDLTPGDGSARQVVRVGAERQDHLVGISRRWHGFGVSTLPVRRVGRRGTAVVSPWWGIGDLAHLPEPGAAERAGRLVAQLHRASGTGRRAPVEAVPPGVEMIAELVPALAPRLTDLARALSDTLGGSHPVSLVHGDLSPDQVLWDGEDEVRVVDLDRSAQGAPGSDLGSWLATCALTGQQDLAVGFLAGYRSVVEAVRGRTGRAGVGAAQRGRPASRELAGWCGRALLAAALEPFRRGDPDWRQRVTARVGLAEDVLAGRGGIPT